jgi:hypothetical protein
LLLDWSFRGGPVCAKPDDFVTKRILGGFLLFHDALQAEDSRYQRVLGFTPKALNARPERPLLLRTRRRDGLCQKRFREAAPPQRDPRGSYLVDGGRDHLQAVMDFAESLLRESAAFNLAKWILDVNEDVLGCYFYSVPDPSKPWRSERRESYIELYWAVIGLVARAIGTDVEDLAVVVLAHELAHAYTHVGCDIDGESWSSSAFCAADRALTEGLAQYYTFRVCDKIKTQLPGVLGAFETLS